jgi:hypothetical protein
MPFHIPLMPAHRQWWLAIDTAADLPVSGAGPVAASSPTRPSRTGGCNPSIEACAEAMGGKDPDAAYAAAMLWYQGYPDPPHPGV